MRVVDEKGHKVGTIREIFIDQRTGSIRFAVLDGWRRVRPAASPIRRPGVSSSSTTRAKQGSRSSSATG